MNDHKPDVTLNFLCGMGALLGGFLVTPLLAEALLTRLQWPTASFFALHAIVLLSCTAYGELKLPRRQTIAARYAVLGFLLQFGFWMALAAALSQSE